MKLTGRQIRAAVIRVVFDVDIRKAFRSHNLGWFRVRLAKRVQAELERMAEELG
jgi:hypothetical protein